MSTRVLQADDGPKAEAFSVVLSYKDLGWVLTRVARGSKVPIDVGWQSAAIPTTEQLREWFETGRFNPGLRLGSVSGNVYDLDCDDERLIPFLKELAPEWARSCPAWTHRGRPHVLLRLDSEVPYLKFQLAGKTLLEVRGEGHQSLLPPSVHPDGSRYQWTNGPFQPPLVSAGEALAWVENTVVAFGLSLGWTPGSRHDIALAAAGWMARRGIPLARALEILACIARGDGFEADDRLRAVRDTYEGLASSERATGWPTLERLLPPEAARLLRNTWRKVHDDDEERAGPYVVRHAALYWLKPGRDGATPTKIANFDLRIVREVRRDDGSEILQTVFEVAGRGERGDFLSKSSIPASEFNGMNWLLPAFGSRTIIGAGPGTKDRVREAIQQLSGESEKATVYTHTGWRLIGDVWRFLHAGMSGQVEVELDPCLAGYRIPPAPADPHDAIRTSLALLDLSDSPVVAALWCAMYLAPLASILKPDFTTWLWGPTGSWKTTLSALFVSHYGEFGRKDLSLDWSSTENYLERAAFLAKDVPLVIDEFAPPAGRLEQQMLQAKASRVLRAQGNIAGRGRMRADTTLRGSSPPRGLIIATAEMPPPVTASAVARTLVLELRSDDIDRERLTTAQAHTGELRAAMAGYLEWLAPQHETLRRDLPGAFRRLVQNSTVRGHRRTPEILAHLEIAAGLAVTWFRHCDAITAGEAVAVIHRVKGSLDVLGTAQAAQVQHANPAEQFCETLAELLAKRAVFCCGRHGGEPPDCERLGWEARLVSDKETGQERESFPARGASQVGWADEDWLYLLPKEAFRAVAQFLQPSGQTLGASEESLHRALEEAGLIEVRQNKELRRTVVVLLDGAQRRVLKFRRSAVVRGGKG